MDRYHALVQTFGQEHFEKVKNSHILVVGAGGIGCEILKNLVLSGFLSIEVIDLDTIDVSNLNRQFLFRPEHVGQPKAVVAAAAAKGFNPDVNIIAHYGNVKDTKFGIPYVSKFNVVLNALDNIDARRHVNRLCLGANVPLIDSGTTGYLGQVMPIFKGRTACYECMPKPTQKVYPICTIRSTPDKPVHCIVWAKECFKLLFGNTSESMLYEDPESGEQSTYMDLVAFPLELQKSPKGLVAHGCAILTALYSTEVEKKIDMGIYKTAKIAPKGVDSISVMNAGVRALDIIEKNLGGVQTSNVVDWDRMVWGDEDAVVEILLCMWEACSFTDMIGKMSFDKDDMLGMRFVCASSNIRSNVFGIPPMSFHDAKGIALLPFICHFLSSLSISCCAYDFLADPYKGNIL
jgi:ubiquitin-like 1-activating enzyme E1 B